MANASEIPKPDEVGWLFVQQYYTMMNKKPGNLHLFYKSKSSFVHGTEGETVKLSQGQQEIHDRISDLNLKDCRVLVSNVDSQGSLDGGILIQVLGEISNDGQESRKFAQTFSLAPQESGFYVYNDIFRFLKEDVESDAGDDFHIQNNSSAQPQESTTNGIESSYPHETEAAKQPTPVPTSQAAEAIAELTSEVHAPAPASKIVSDIEKTATGSQHAPSALTQEGAASPVQTPVKTEEAEEKTSRSSEAVEAIAKPPPAVEKKPEEAKPMAPLSWAARAAANAANQAQAIVTKAVAPKATSAKTPTPAADSEKKAQATKTGTSADVTRSAFLKNITSNMTDDAVRSALRKYGEYKNVEIYRQKQCGFVDYLDAGSCAAAIKANTLNINDEILYVEERKRDSNGKIGPKEKRFDQNREQRGDNANRGGRGSGRGGKASRGAATPK